MRKLKIKVYVNNQLQYLCSTWTGLISQSSWLLGLAGVVSSWKFSRVDIMSWTCRFSSLISCHNWETNTDKHKKSQDFFSDMNCYVLSDMFLMPYSPAAISAENCCPARCTRTSWFVLASHDREHWPSCSFPARRIHGPASRSHWFLLDSWCCGNTDTKLSHKRLLQPPCHVGMMANTTVLHSGSRGCFIQMAQKNRGHSDQPELKRTNKLNQDDAVS